MTISQNNMTIPQLQECLAKLEAHTAELQTANMALQENLEELRKQLDIPRAPQGENAIQNISRRF